MLHSSWDSVWHVWCFSLHVFMHAVCLNSYQSQVVTAIRSWGSWGADGPGCLLQNLPKHSPKPAELNNNHGIQEIRHIWRPLILSILLFNRPLLQEVMLSWQHENIVTEVVKTMNSSHSQFPNFSPAQIPSNFNDSITIAYIKCCSYINSQKLKETKTIFTYVLGVFVNQHFKA